MNPPLNPLICVFMIIFTYQISNLLFRYADCYSILNLANPICVNSLNVMNYINTSIINIIIKLIM